LIFPLVVKKSSKHLAVLPSYIGRFLALGFFGATATIFGSLGYVRSLAAYVEAVKQVEVPLTLVVGLFFFNERERVREIAAGSGVMIAGLLILIFSS
jgi:drug/metabolite transporter (DMT)-like permease